MMRKVMLLGGCLMITGCSGFGKFVSDTATLPGANPNAPLGSDLNMRRVKGYGASEAPILTQGGNVWPGPPSPMPTLEDVEKDRIGTALGATSSADEMLPDGGEINLDISSKVAPSAKLPDAEPDAASKFGAKRSNASAIQIPNGDGTVTIIRPDGSVYTIKASAAPAATH